VLQETGFPKVAEHYKKKNSAQERKSEVSRELISDIVSKYLGITGDNLHITVDRVEKACTTLALQEVSPVLILELGKHYKEQSFSIPQLATPDKIHDNENSPWKITRGSILSQVSADTRFLVTRQILGITGVSRLFPALKIDFDLGQFVNYLNLTTPLTELAIIPHLKIVADGINDFITVIASITGNKNNSESYPIYLSLIEISGFSTRCLGSNWPDSKPICQDLIEYLEKMMKQRLFKYSFI